MGLLAVPRARRAPLLLVVLSALAAPGTAHASDVIALQTPRDRAQVHTGAEVVFRFTALRQSSTVLPKIEVSRTGRQNADGSFVHADVAQTTTAQIVAGVANTFQVRSRALWTRQPGRYWWHAVTFYCGDPYNCVVNSVTRQLVVLRQPIPVLFHSVTIKKVRRTYIAWVWLGSRATVAGQLVRQLPKGRERLVRNVRRRTMPPGRRPISLGVLKP